MHEVQFYNAETTQNFTYSFLLKIIFKLSWPFVLLINTILCLSINALLNHLESVMGQISKCMSFRMQDKIVRAIKTIRVQEEVIKISNFHSHSRM
jgi:hypothetical protein